MNFVIANICVPLLLPILFNKISSLHIVTSSDISSLELEVEHKTNLTFEPNRQEGAKNYTHFEIQSVVAGMDNEYDGESVKRIKSVLSNKSDKFNICTGAVQRDLLYGMNKRTSSDYLPAKVDEDETLAEAVCCDSSMLLFAEPQHTYNESDIGLFRRIDHDGITTFYDSVCGLPLFRAPVGRTFEEFEADTIEHGWPSFRKEEVIAENVMTSRTQEFVFSTCGTHLGSYLPDIEGDRWCIDLACISGQEIFHAD